MNARPDSCSTRDTGKWLHAAATPVFAGMALLTAATHNPADMLCTSAHGMSMLGGMTCMYVLMALVHAGPWLSLLQVSWRRYR